MYFRVSRAALSTIASRCVPASASSLRYLRGRKHLLAQFFRARDPLSTSPDIAFARAKAHISGKFLYQVSRYHRCVSRYILYIAVLVDEDRPGEGEGLRSRRGGEKITKNAYAIIAPIERINPATTCDKMIRNAGNRRK